MVTPDHIAQIVSRWTGIPVDKMLEGEREKLLRMEDELAKRVCWTGRGGAICFAGCAPRPRRPSGSEPAYWFVHVPRPTGFGKTELTKALASFF